MSLDFQIGHIRNHSLPLRSDRDLDRLLEEIGESRYVLLGEASHGTSDFYTWRRELSKRLIEEKGFHFIAVEGDWPPCYEVNRYIKGYDEREDRSAEKILMDQFQRWPAWMWANREIAEFVKWLYQYNRQNPHKQQIGFYGIDVYSLWESMDEIIRYLQMTGSAELEAAKKAFSCFEPFGRDPQFYGMNAAFFSEACEQEVVELLTKLQEKRNGNLAKEENSLSAELNALVAVNAERYYRSMVRGGSDSWNIRDRHMVSALYRIMDFYGPEAKVIVWEHNTHIGDARATDMVKDGMVNVGQLLREQNPSKDVFAAGFATYRGSVVAGRSWGSPLEIMNVPPAQPQSWESLMHRAGDGDKLFIFDPDDPIFQEELGHRAIGVVYLPEYERFGNYVPTRLSKRYDALLYIEKTTALQPLSKEVALV